MKAKIKLFEKDIICEFVFTDTMCVPWIQEDIGQLISIDNDTDLLATFIEMGFEDDIKEAILCSTKFS